MDTKYKVYPISELNSLDWDLFTHDEESCRKSVDGTQFIVKYINPPHGNTITLTHEEAITLMRTPEWTDSTDE